MRLTLPQQKYPELAKRSSAFFEELTRRVQNVPGVAAAAMVSQFPPIEPFTARSRSRACGTPARRCRRRTRRSPRATTSRRYGCRVVKGRVVRRRRHARCAAPRVIVNQAFVVALSRGRAIRSPRASGSPAAAVRCSWSEIVGVVGDAQEQRRRRAGPARDLHPDGAGTRRLEPAVPAGRASDRDAAALVPSVRGSRRVDRPRAAGLRDPDDGGGGGDCRRSSSASRRCCSVFRGGRAGARGGRDLRRDVATRSARGRRRSACGWRSAPSAADVLRLVLMQVARLAVIGLVVGIGPAARRRQGAVAAALRREARGSADDRGRHADARRGRLHRRLGAGLARQPSRPDSRAAIRIDAARPRATC